MDLRPAAARVGALGIDLPARMAAYSLDNRPVHGHRSEIGVTVESFPGRRSTASGPRQRCGCRPAVVAHRLEIEVFQDVQRLHQHRPCVQGVVPPHLVAVEGGAHRFARIGRGIRTGPPSQGCRPPSVIPRRSAPQLVLRRKRSAPLAGFRRASRTPPSMRRAWLSTCSPARAAASARREPEPPGFHKTPPSRPAGSCRIAPGPSPTAAARACTRSGGCHPRRNGWRLYHLGKGHRAVPFQHIDEGVHDARLGERQRRVFPRPGGDALVPARPVELSGRRARRATLSG